MNVFVQFSDGDEDYMELIIAEPAIQIPGFVAFRVTTSGPTFGTIVYYPYHRINIIMAARAQ